MERAIKRDFSTVRTPREFLDFLWESSPSRESLARLLLRISTDAGVWVVASVNDKGAWIVAADWQRDERLLQEVARDLFDPIDELMLGLPDAEQRRLRQFLNTAALCDPAVPVQHVLAALGWNENARDEFLDRVDELLGEDGKVPVFADLGYSNPGFPSTELLYRFRNPRCPELS